MRDPPIVVRRGANSVTASTSELKVQQDPELAIPRVALTDHCHNGVARSVSAHFIRFARCRLIHESSVGRFKCSRFVWNCKEVILH